MTTDNAYQIGWLFLLAGILVQDWLYSRIRGSDGAHTHYKA